MAKNSENMAYLTGDDVREAFDGMDIGAAADTVAATLEKPSVVDRRSSVKKPTAAQVKHWAIKYDTMIDCEAGESLGFELRHVFSRSKTLEKVWQRGQMLKQLAAFGATNYDRDKIEVALGMAPGELQTLFETDADAVEVFNHARIKFHQEIGAAFKGLVKAGKVPPSTVKAEMAMLKREVAKKAADYENVPTQIMADLCGVSRVTLQNEWVTKHGCPKNVNGTYDLAKFIPWYGQFTLEKAQRQPGKYLATPEDEAARLRNRKIQMQIDEMEKRLVPADAAMASFVARAAAVDQFIAASGTNLYLMIAGTDETTIRQTLADYNAGIRQASAAVPSGFAEMLPERVAAGFVQLMELLAEEGGQNSELRTQKKRKDDNGHDHSV